ncbi:histidine kinase N-terminal 7TM domain-containing protein [Halobacteriaceae archaeon SHR40]|uniref:sensor histidine kinase n=1 Tax=Halovenus amylolytica TaxID=2500550 RepID=UPI000FE3C8CB
MTLDLQLLRVLLLGNFVLGLVFVYYLFNNRKRRAATSLIVLFGGLLIWLLADIIQVWTPANPAPPVGIPLRMVGADITIIGLLLFAVEYTGREGVIRKRVVALLSMKPVLSLVVVLTPSLDRLLEIATPETVAQGYEFVVTPFFIFHVSYNWILTAVAIAVLLRMLVKGMYGNQRQLFVVLVAVSIPIGCNVLLRLGLIRLDLTTAAFFVTATGLMYATFRLRLLDALPIARQTVLAEMDELVFVLDETGVIVTANDAATDRFGDERDLSGTHITAVLGSDAATIQSSGDQKVDIITKIDNKQRHFTVSQTTLTDNYEMVVGQLLVCRDVTERVHRERELEELNTRLKLSLNETDTGVWEWDPDTTTIVWDEASERLFGYGPGEFPGTVDAFASRVHEADFSAVQDAIDTAVETGEDFRTDFRVEPADGKQRWVRARGVVETDDSNTTIRVIGIQTDITDFVEQRQALERKNEQLDRFAGMISHDLRNPLTVAKLRLELAQKEFGSEDLNAVQDAHDRMETMIGDLLTLAKTGETIDATERFSFADIARDAWKNADVGDCEFETSIPETVDIVADRDRLLHVFENLYRNAADHNETTVTVRVGLLNEHEPATDWSQQPGFFIEDSGHGIPLKQQANIFEEGYTTSSTGSGYGLSIVHDIVEAHGGDIRVSNGPGGGARFEVTGFKLTTE